MLIKKVVEAKSKLAKDDILVEKLEIPYSLFKFIGYEKIGEAGDELEVRTSLLGIKISCVDDGDSKLLSPKHFGRFVLLN